jgi:hypothetical protein
MNHIIVWALGVFLAIWCFGWLCSACYMYFYGPGSDEKGAVRERFVGALVINAFLWPALLPGLRRHRRFQNDLKTGRRPQWLIYADGESDCAEWTLANGMELSTSASAGSSTERTRLQVTSENNATSLGIECRVQMIAPDKSDPSEWKSMKVKQYMPEPDTEDEDDKEFPFHEAAMRLPKGKYRGEFRRQVNGVFEEGGAITFIVADSEDYDL